MNNKKKVEKKSAVKIAKREPGKAVKQNFMLNLRDFPSLPQRHPVEDLLFANSDDIDTVGFDLEPTTDAVSENNPPPNSTHIEIVSKKPSVGDLATQAYFTGNPNTKNPGVQDKSLGNPNVNDLATQHMKIGYPNPDNLDSQELESGNPSLDKLATIQPKKGNWQPKNPSEGEDLDGKKPKDFNLATQNAERKDAPKFLKKYDKARATKPLHTRISESVDLKIRHFIVDHEFTLKDFIEISATRFIDEFGNPNKKDLGGNQPYDDRRLRLTWKTKAALINLYLRYNLVLNPNSKWTVNDDDAACKFNECDFRLLELGIIQTQANKKFTGKIGSFSYYTNEIQNFIDLNLPEDSIGIMLEINRKRWTQATGREIDLSFLKEISATG